MAHPRWFIDLQKLVDAGAILPPEDQKKFDDHRTKNRTAQYERFRARVKNGETLTLDEQKEYDAYRAKRSEMSQKSMATNPMDFANNQAKRYKVLRDKIKAGEQLLADDYRWYVEYRIKLNSGSAASAAKNPEQTAATSKKWYDDHREGVAERLANRYQVNKAELDARTEASLQKRLKAGQCRDCTRPRLKHSKSFCLHHWIKSMLRRALKTSEGLDELIPVFEKKLQEQNYRCPYLGIELIPNFNASIDHIIPRDRIGEAANVPDNLQWISMTAQYMKGRHTPREFFNLCRIVFSNTPEEFKSDHDHTYYQHAPFGHHASTVVTKDGNT